MIRMEALDAIAPFYFVDLDVSKDVNYHRFYLGEDRYLTHLLMIMYPSHSIGFCFSACCKTEAPDTIEKYMKQRRRCKGFPFLPFFTFFPPCHSSVNQIQIQIQIHIKIQILTPIEIRVPANQLPFRFFFRALGFNCE